jgi:hypothetical protein
VASDSYKNSWSSSSGPTYLKAGLAYVALDMPGTGESPIKIDVGAERIFSRVIDALQSRTDLDTTRSVSKACHGAGTGRRAWPMPSRNASKPW